jgi:hypothetical protein
MPTYPLGFHLNPLTNPWVEKLTQTRTLIEQKPTGFQVAGTHCHLYLGPVASVFDFNSVWPSVRVSLGTLISHGIFIFPREISSFSLGKMKIPWEISVPKLALKVRFPPWSWITIHAVRFKLSLSCCRAHMVLQGCM